MNDSKINRIHPISSDSEKLLALRTDIAAISTRSRITEDLRTKIVSGSILPGELLPSRRGLAQEYGVAIGTVQSAITDLISDGLLIVRDRMGTFVAENVKHLAVPMETTEKRDSKFGLVLQQEDGWPASIARVVEQEVSRDGGMTLFANAWPNGNKHPLADAIQEVTESGADGIAIILPMTDDPFGDIAHVFNEKTPHCVFIVSQPVLSPLVSCVYYDSRDAGYQAAQHLLRQGARELLFFAPCTAHWVLERFDGAKQAIMHAGMQESALQNAIAPISYAQFKEQGRAYEEASYSEAKQYLQHNRPPMGIVAANDDIALGFWRAAEEIGLRPGRDFALIGFDDNPKSRQKGLSSLHPPLEALGLEAARLLMQRRQGQIETRRVCVRSCLTTRHSTHLSRAAGPRQLSART